jgi:hypothetical protein
MGSFQLPVVKEPQVVHEFEYRDTLVRFALSTYRGRTYMDIRTFWQPSPGEPWQPTKKGMRHSVEALDDWRAGIAAIEAAVDGTERSSSTWSDESVEAA